MKTLRILSFVTAGILGAALQAADSTGKVAPTVIAQPANTPALKRIDYKSDPAMVEYAKQAGSQAIADWMKEFLMKPVSAKRFAILPFGADVDDGYFTAQARNAFASGSLGSEFSLYTRDDPEWKTLLKEIRLGDQEGDTMDKATIQKFGRVQGVQGVINGRIAGVYIGNAPNDRGVRLADDAKILQVRIVMQAFEVETGRLVWGGEKVAAVLLPDDGLFLNLTKMQLLTYGAIALAAIILLMVILRGMKSAHRPR